MSEIGTLYTSGQWNAMAGKEEEFIRAWEKYATWTAQNFKASGARLMRDSENANKFLSFGRWESQGQIDQWRATPEFQEFVKLARSLCDLVEPHTFKVVAEAG